MSGAISSVLLHYITLHYITYLFTYLDSLATLRVVRAISILIVIVI